MTPLTAARRSAPKYEYALAAAAPTRRAERPLPLAARACGSSGWLRKGVILRRAGAALGAGRALAGQRPAAAHLRCRRRAPSSRAWPAASCSTSARDLAGRCCCRAMLLGVVAAFVLTTLAVSTQLGRDLLATLTVDVQPAAGHRAAAAGAAVVRPGQRQPGLRAGALGAVAAGAEHLRRLPGACPRRCAWPAATTA